MLWAANANAPYKLSDNGTVSVDYSKVKAVTLDHVDVIAPNATAVFNVSGKTTLTVKGGKIQSKIYCAATNASTS
ncbi:MAG: hypothetical protein PUG64_02570, partial [Bacteroidales bacterium]|nr:hypothetical protein [Bacteroidales bacterium]